MSELRFELKTCGLKVQCSTKLSYTLYVYNFYNKKFIKQIKLKKPS